MFFYLQNTRFLVAKESRSYFNIKNNYVYWDLNLVTLIVIFGCVNVWGILYIDDAIIHIANVFVYSY